MEKGSLSTRVVDGGERFTVHACGRLRRKVHCPGLWQMREKVQCPGEWQMGEKLQCPGMWQMGEKGPVSRCDCVAWIKVY